VGREVKDAQAAIRKCRDRDGSDVSRPGNIIRRNSKNSRRDEVSTQRGDLCALRFRGNSSEDSGCFWPKRGKDQLLAR
jgi:hypothetical protein